MASTQLGAITVTEAPRATIARLRGEIDLDVKDTAAQALEAMRTRAVPIVVDASEVTFLASTGVAFLVDCAKRAVALGVGITLVRPPHQVVYVLEILGIAPLFRVASEEPDDVWSARPA